MPHRSWRRPRQLTALAASGLLVGAVVPAMAFTQASALPPESGVRAGLSLEGLDVSDVPDKEPRAGVYNVVLSDQPATAYDGHLSGYAATRPNVGDTFQNDDDAARYRSYLVAQQDEVLNRISAQEPRYRYTAALNGFSARLSGAQVSALRSMPGVLTVQPDRIRQLETIDSPRFLGLAGRNGVWEQNGGTERAGKNVVVGVLDSGIWPENPSFAGSARAPDPRGFNGVCTKGEDWPRNTCNGKVIAARYFNKGFGVEDIAEEDYLSARDGDGHGSHTASTAAGNNGVRVRIEGQSFGRASGMAPAAYIAVYKVCWEATDPDNTGCSDSDSVAAIDRAVLDGVDVLNYSISGSSDNFADPVELAFLGAAAGGTFVATSAGNSGPTASTVAHPSPWVATVAASTHHLFQGSVVLGNGRSYVGAMTSDKAVSERRIILSTDAASADADREEARLCYPDTLDRDQVEDRIVVCDRGVIDRVAKSAEVERAGGAGMVLTNTEPNSLDADFHSVPTVHLDENDGAKVKQYVESQGRRATAALNPEGRDDTRVPQIAGFSSRGPLLAGEGNILKPDLSAPGVSVIAAVAPPSNSGRRWDAYSGTSMASPHVAGLGAFMKNLRPDWSPAIIKSAMMTTAYDLSGPHGPFAQGAGHVNPRRFLDPGLAYDAGHGQWLRFLTGDRTASNVNQASIAVGQLTGTETVQRRVTNVSDKPETYTAVVRGLEGIATQVRPSTIRVAPQRVQKFAVNFTATEAARFNKYSSGHLVWRGSRGHVVRTPLAVQPVAVSAPDEVLVPSNTSSGEKVIVGKAGFTGSLDLAVVGLDGARPVQDSVDEGDFALFDSVQVPGGTSVARFDLNAEDDADDLDLYIGVGDDLVAASASGAADEQVTLTRPAAGTYDVYVDGFEDAQGDGDIPFTLTSWVVPAGDQGNLTVSPDPVPVTNGERFRYTASWDNLGIDQRWFGYVNYVGRGDRTYITIN